MPFNPQWIKPNAKGLLLYASSLFVALNLLPTPMFRYSAMSGRAAVIWPWPWALAAISISIALYVLSMRAGSGLPKTGAAQTLAGPLAIIPLSLLVAIAIGLFVYVPPEVHGNLERHLFLQGNTDWGGGCTFAAFISLYVAFGFLSAWYLSLSLETLPASVSYGRALLKSIWILKFHALLFFAAGIAPWSYDARVTPNDFRNLFLFAALVYACSIAWVAALRNLRLPRAARLALAPLFTVLWLVLGSDGNTARAGQLVHAGQDPQPIVRGVRHGIMLSWHRLCDSALGDVSE